MSKKTEEPQDTVRLLRRKPALGTAALQRRSRDRKVTAKRFQRFINFGSQCFDLPKRKSVCDTLNHLRWRKVFYLRRQYRGRFRSVCVASVLSNHALAVFLATPNRDFLFRSPTHLGILNDSNGLRSSECQMFRRDPMSTPVARWVWPHQRQNSERWRRNFSRRGFKAHVSKRRKAKT
jgi:hypothetical protein